MSGQKCVVDTKIFGSPFRWKHFKQWLKVVIEKNNLSLTKTSCPNESHRLSHLLGHPINMSYIHKHNSIFKLGSEVFISWYQDMSTNLCHKKYFRNINMRRKDTICRNLHINFLLHIINVHAFKKSAEHIYEIYSSFLAITELTFIGKNREEKYKRRGIVFYIPE